MSWRIVVISKRCKLDLKMGYMVIRSEETKRIYLDEISMALCPLTKDMFLICHGNSKNFTNAIKKIFLHKLALSCTFIVFNNQMAKPF